MNKRLLDILCCPVSKTPVTPLAKSQLETLNAAIARGGVTTVADGPVEQPFEAGLITIDGKRIYRIDDDIPIMLADEAIVAAQIEGLPGAG